MLHAIEKNKAGRNFDNQQVNWRELFKTSEDSHTSSVFEKLFYLPVELFWRLLKNSCFANDLPGECGRILSFEFWPKWDASETSNNNFVEPDLFIRFQNFDLIIEAKRFDNNQQDTEQWNKEIISYHNEYNDDKKEVYLLALGGIRNEQTEEVNSVKVIKSQWIKLLKEIKLVYNQLQSSKGYISGNDATLVVLNDLITAFRLHGFSTGQWFSETSLSDYYSISYSNSKDIMQQWEIPQPKN